MLWFVLKLSARITLTTSKTNHCAISLLLEQTHSERVSSATEVCQTWAEVAINKVELTVRQTVTSVGFASIVVSVVNSRKFSASVLLMSSETVEIAPEIQSWIEEDD